MELVIWTIKFKRNHGDEWENGILIGSTKIREDNGGIIFDKCFSLKVNIAGNTEIIPINPNDMIDIEYSYTTHFKL